MGQYYATYGLEPRREKGLRGTRGVGCGKCQAILDTAESPADAEDTFTPALIAHVAEENIGSCVRKLPGHLEGYAKVRPKKIFEVVVAGCSGWCLQYAVLQDQLNVPKS